MWYYLSKVTKRSFIHSFIMVIVAIFTIVRRSTFVWRQYIVSIPSFLAFIGSKPLRYLSRLFACLIGTALRRAVCSIKLINIPLYNYYWKKRLFQCLLHRETYATNRSSWLKFTSCGKRLFTSLSRIHFITYYTYS